MSKHIVQLNFELDGPIFLMNKALKLFVHSLCDFNMYRYLVLTIIGCFKCRIITYYNNFHHFLFQLSAAGSATGTAESGMGNKIGGSGGGSSAAPLTASSDPNQLENATSNTENISHRLTSNGEDGEDPVGEVPPPMQPMSTIPVKPSELPCPSGLEKVII